MGCVPVLVDVEPDTYNIDLAEAQKAIGPKTRAIMPFHLHRTLMPDDRIEKLSRDNGIYLIEDACEPTGAEFQGRKVGTFGDVGTFSFFMSHHVSTIEGGWDHSDG